LVSDDLMLVWEYRELTVTGSYIPGRKDGSALCSIDCEHWWQSEQQRWILSVRPMCRWERDFTGLLTCDLYGSVETGWPVDQCCAREAQCGWRTKINWTKTAHNTIPWPFTYTHAHAVM